MRILVQDIDNLQRSTRREVERSAVRTLLQEYFGYPILILHHSDGRPYIPSIPELHISISHTLGRVAVALSSAPIGIDLERFDERIPRAVMRILSEETQAYLEAPSTSNRAEMAHILWTSSEALYKLVSLSHTISDFIYDLSSIAYNANDGHFALKASYKGAPEATLLVEGSFEGSYILTTARYLLLKE